MNAEKIVKTEAKKMLSSKWPTAIFSTLELLFVPIISMVVIFMAYSILDDTESVAQALSASPVSAVLFVVFHLAAVLA